MVSSCYVMGVSRLSAYIMFSSAGREQTIIIAFFVARTFI